MRNQLIITLSILLFFGMGELAAKNVPFANCCKEQIVNKANAGKNATTTGRIKMLPSVQKPVRSLHHPTAADAIIYNGDYGAMHMDIFQMIMGRVAGVFVSGGPAFYQIRIRGALRPPLVVVDGMRFFSEDDASINSLLMSIPVQDVDAIEVIKNPATGLIYGPGAGNGVIVIHTKRGFSDE